MEKETYPRTEAIVHAATYILVCGLFLYVDYKLWVRV